MIKRRVYLFLMLLTAMLACSACNKTEAITVQLAVPEGLSVNGKLNIVTWDNVAYANSYVVKIDEDEYVALNNSFSLDSLTETGTYNISVAAQGYTLENIIFNKSVFCAAVQYKKEAVVLSEFDIYRSDRDKARQEAVLFLESIIQSATASEEQKLNAVEQRIQLTMQWENCLVAEFQIKRLGLDSIIAVSDTKINVLVKPQGSTGLAADQVTSILEIVQNIFDTPINNVNISAI